MAVFPKSQRLCSRKAIEALFGGGSQSITAFPLRVIYKQTPHTRLSLTSPSQPDIQVLFSVSKRRFKHAVDRNRAKRQLREAWRHYQHLLSVPSISSTSLRPIAASSSAASSTSYPLGVGSGTATALPPLHIAFLWLADTPQPSSLVHRKMKNLLCRISSSFPSASTSDSSLH